MEKEVFENSSEIIAFIPRSKYRWLYYIDNGKPHIIHQDDISKFIKNYISKFSNVILQDIIMRHQPFIVIISENKIVELEKERIVDFKERRNKIDKEINSFIKSNYNKNNNSIYDESKDWFDSMIKNFKNF